MPYSDSQTAIIASLRSSFPHLIAIYAFGSQVQNTATANSDLDLAILVEGMVDPLKLWELREQLVALAGCEVDLLDFRAASTVMQYQILCGGVRLWEADARAGIYEAMVLNHKTELDCARAGLLSDILNSGKVYDR